MHPDAERYDRKYRKPRYFMKEWRQQCFTIWMHSLSSKPIKYATFMDVGCGRAESVDIARSFGLDARGCEIAPGRCERDDVDLLEIGAIDLPYETDSFDIVTSMDVLEHIEPENVLKCLDEILRIARHIVLIGVPSTPTTDPRDHQTVEPPRWWKHRLRERSQHVNDISGDMPIPNYKKPYSYFEVIP